MTQIIQCYFGLSRDNFTMMRLDMFNLIYTPRYLTIEFHEIKVVLILCIKVINFLFEMKIAKHFYAFR